MRRLAFMFVSAVFAIALVNSPEASAAGKTITIIGGSTCSDWTEAKRVAALDRPSDLGWISVSLRRSWLVGYMSALNASSSSDKNILKSVDADIIETWIDKYCLQNPKMSIGDGADKLFIELVKING